MKKAIIIGVIVALTGTGYILMNQKPHREQVQVDVEEAKEAQNTKKYNYNVVSQSQWGSTSNATADSKRPDHSNSDVTNNQTASLDESKPRVKAVKKVIASSGIEQQFLGMNTMLEQQIELMLSDENLSDEETAQFLENFRKKFDGKRMVDELSAKILENMSENELQQLSEIYDDPIVSKFNQMDYEAMDLEQTQQDYLEFQKRLESEPLSAETVKYIKQIDEGTGASKHAAEFAVKMYNAYAEDSGETPTAEELKNIQNVLADQIQGEIAYKLRDTPPEDQKHLAVRLTNEAVYKMNLLKKETTEKTVEEVYNFRKTR